MPCSASWRSGTAAQSRSGGATVRSLRRKVKSHPARELTRELASPTASVKRWRPFLDKRSAHPNYALPAKSGRIRFEKQIGSRAINWRREPIPLERNALVDAGVDVFLGDFHQITAISA